MARVWTCQGCKTENPRVKQRCPVCARKRPKPRPPAHMQVLEAPYEETAARFDNVCGICGSAPKARRLHRDHEHSGTGKIRGLLCFRDNSALRPYMDAEWLYSAWRYLVRHELMSSERLAWNVEDRGHDTSCWIWQRALHSAGYGVINYKGQVLYVHRIMHAGPIPDGYHVDHLCRQRACVNPAHLEAVTPAENNRRAVDVATCKRGHPWTPENTYIRQDNGWRQCRACIEMRSRGLHKEAS